MKEGGEEEDMGIPPLFRCPISLDLLRDPVTLCTGQTYDRSSIEKWLAAGNSTCPITMQKLHDPSMVPNHTLRHLIQDWVHQVSFFDVHIKTMDLDAHISALMHNLCSTSITLDQKVQTLEKVLVLAEDLPLQNTALVQLGFFRVILDLVFEEIISVGFAEQALVCALKLLPFSDSGAIVSVLSDQESRFVNFLTLFEHGSSLIKKCLCNFMEAAASISSSVARKLGKSGRLLRELISLVNNDGDCEVSSAAIEVISSLSCLEQNREAMVKLGAMESLIACVLANAQKCKTSSAPMAMRAIELLMASESAKEAVFSNPSGVTAMVKMIFRVSDHGGSDSAVSCLTMICRDSLQTREEAICSGVLTQLLLLLQSQCCGRTKTRARLLLKLLRSM